jgi:hypothetical protein
MKSDERADRRRATTVYEIACFLDEGTPFGGLGWACWARAGSL